MKAVALFSGQPLWMLPCSSATATYPPSELSLHSTLHFVANYLKTVQEQELQLPPHTKVYARLANACYENRTQAAEIGQEVGYTFVGEAAEDDDVTRLFQHSETLDCIIGFRGSDAAGDWIDNAGFGSRSFCNFEDVHSGFVQKFVTTVTATVFQNNIRAHFPKCASITATGHSLGGAVAELFAGCANRGMQGLTPLAELSRGNGLTVAHRGWMEYMQYKGQIAWNRGTPELIPDFMA